MNEVFLEGIIVSANKPEHQATQNNHQVFQLQVTHRNRQGQFRHELYTVNAWNRLADWAQANLKSGVPVLVKGYLTQRSHKRFSKLSLSAQ